MRTIVFRETFFVLSNYVQNKYWMGAEYHYTGDVREAKRFKSYDQAYCFAREEGLDTPYPVQMFEEVGFAE